MKRSPRNGLALVAVVVASIAALPCSASAAGRPVKETLKQFMGWEVNSAKGDLCLVESEVCQEATASKEPGGFEFPEGVAVGPGPEHYVYVADKVNARIQVFTAAGAFVAMYGWEVQKVTKANVCEAAAAAKGECQPGQPATGGPAGQIGQPTSIAVDQATGDLYILDFVNHRIEKYTANGEFLLTIGRNVNKKGGNICLGTEQQECQAGELSAPSSKEADAFKPESGRGNLLTIGADPVEPAQRILYVGDEGRVQEIAEDGKFVREIPVPGHVGALTVDGEDNVYLTEESIAAVIHKFAGDGKEIFTPCSGTAPCWPLTVHPKENEVIGFGIETLAVDGSGRLAIGELESYRQFQKPHTKAYGTLLDGASGQFITEFTLDLGLPEESGLLGAKGIAFSTAETAEGGFPMYVATDRQTVLGYGPVPVGELSLKPEHCQEAAPQGTNARWNCVLNGEINPWGVGNTEVWFEWGRTPNVPKKTPLQIICKTCGSTPEDVSAVVEDVRPNESPLYYRLTGVDANVHLPESLISELGSFETPLVPAWIGSPSVSFVRASSAVMASELNPENAKAQYYFEYAAGEETLAARCPEGLQREDCTSVAMSATREAPCPNVEGQFHCVYGVVNTVIGAAELQPATLYHYRLFVESVNTKEDKSEGSIGPEGTFTTAPAPVPAAVTGPASSVGATSATITGTVNPDGQPATYAFELGIYSPSGTQYGTVFSSTLAASSVPVPESVNIAGLQPGTEYAYRLTVKSGYGQSTGASVRFTTGTLPSVLPGLASPPMLLPPPVAFPVQCKRGYVLDKQGKCVKQVKGKHKRRHKRHARRRA